MRVINSHIEKGEFKNLYLICGTEAYLRKQAKDKLKESVIAADDTMNFSYFEGKKIDINEVAGLAQTLPFFSDRRLIIIEDAGLAKGTPDEVMDVIASIPDTTYIVFVESEVDKRSKLYKYIKDNGYVATMDVMDEKTLLMWVKQTLKKSGKQIIDKDVIFFVEQVGSDMNVIKNEIDKLISYCADKDIITEKDINNITITAVSGKIFEMMNAIANKQQKRALSFYHDLIKLKEPPMRILYLLTRQFNIIMQVKALSGKSNQEIASKVGVPPFAVSKHIEQGKKFQHESLIKMLEKCADTDEKIKTGRILDTIGVELLIVEFSE